MKYILLVLLFPFFALGQNLDQKISEVQQEIVVQKAVLQKLQDKLELLNLESVIVGIKKLGLPSNNYIEHSAMILEYSEEHEQAKWVAHAILPAITNGVIARTNDFRIDPLIKTGTAIQEDYFLTDTLLDGTVEYDGYGYDRGHLAPSADFRWSSRALSESYYYSNMSPQHPDLNRQRWADLETMLREYVMTKEVPLYVITAPVLNEGLQKIKRSQNGISIPEQYVKIAVDLENKKGIAFIMPNENLDYPVESFAVTIDEAEELLGFETFLDIDQKIKTSISKKHWFEALNSGDVEPLDQTKLPRYHFNTALAKRKVGRDATVCGKVVSSRYSRKGHLWLNLDKKYPNQIFSVFIRKEDVPHFPYDPKLHLESRVACFQGEVKDFGQSPTINVSSERQVKFLEL